MFNYLSLRVHLRSTLAYVRIPLEVAGQVTIIVPLGDRCIQLLRFGNPTVQGAASPRFLMFDDVVQRGQRPKNVRACA